MELFEVWEHWRQLISKPIIYDEYFENTNNHDFICYLASLIKNAKGRPVIQECRTSCRIQGIKRMLNGLHIYLWRNPWDQWWSFKCANYFDAISQLILNARFHPEVIDRLRKEIQFEEFHDPDITIERSHFSNSRLPAENSYLGFYLIWCLGLLEGMDHSDILVNIDSLSTSEEYRNDTLNRLSDHGITQVDFSDSQIPQGYYTDDEKGYFIRLEKQIRDMLQQSGYSPRQIERLEALRQSNEPRLWSSNPCDIASEDLLRDCARARQIVLRNETESSARYSELTRQMAAQQRKEERLKMHLDLSDRQIHEILREAEGRPVAPSAKGEPFRVGETREIDFSQATSSHYFGDGFHSLETWGVWSGARYSKMIIPIEPGGEPQVEIGVTMIVKAFGGIIRHAPVLRIEVGEQEVGVVLFRPSTKESKEISFSAVIDSPSCEISFSMSNFASPLSLSLNTDARKLGFGIEKVQIGVSSLEGAAENSHPSPPAFWGISDS